MNELGKEALYSLVASSMSVVGPIFLMVVSAVLLTPDAFAANASNMYIVMLFATVVSLQLPSIILRIDPLNTIRDDLERMVILTIPRLIPGIIFCSALFFVLTSIQKIKFNSWGFSLLIFTSIGYQAYLGLLNIFIRRMAIYKQVFAQLFFLGGQLLFVLILIYLVPDSEWIRIVSMLGAIAISFVLIFFLNEVSDASTDTTNPRNLHWEIERYAIWLIPLALSNFVLGYFDKVYASNILAGEYVKEYLIISHIFSAFVILPTAINRLIVPKIFDGRMSIDIIKTSKGLIMISVLIMLYVLAGGAIYAGLKYIFKSTLNSIDFIIIILVATQIARAIYLILVTELHRQYRSSNITFIAVVSALSYVLLTFVFHEGGIIAVCLCALFAQSLQTLGVLFYVASSAKKTRPLA